MGRTTALKKWCSCSQTWHKDYSIAVGDTTKAYFFYHANYGSDCTVFSWATSSFVDLAAHKNTCGLKLIGPGFKMYLPMVKDTIWKIKPNGGFSSAMLVYQGVSQCFFGQTELLLVETTCSDSLLSRRPGFSTTSFNFDSLQKSLKKGATAGGKLRSQSQEVQSVFRAESCGACHLEPGKMIKSYLCKASPDGGFNSSTSIGQNILQESGVWGHANVTDGSGMWLGINAKLLGFTKLLGPWSPKNVNFIIKNWRSNQLKLTVSRQSRQGMRNTQKLWHSKKADSRISSLIAWLVVFYYHFLLSNL